MNGFKKGALPLGIDAYAELIKRQHQRKQNPIAAKLGLLSVMDV